MKNAVCKPGGEKERNQMIIRLPMVLENKRQPRDAEQHCHKRQQYQRMRLDECGGR